MAADAQPANERDFYADGSRGQRIYVHLPTRTIIVQLADDSEQDLPFRKVAHYLVGETYRYPRGIVGLTRQAMISSGIDSAKKVFRILSAEEKEHPERYFINRIALHALGDDFAQQGKQAEANAIFELESERYRSSR